MPGNFLDIPRVVQECDSFLESQVLHRPSASGEEPAFPQRLSKEIPSPVTLVEESLVNRQIVRFLIGSGISQAGDWFGLMAVTWLVVNQLGMTAFHNALLMLAASVLSILGAPLAPAILRCLPISPRNWLIIRNFWEFITGLTLAACVLTIDPGSIFVVILFVILSVMSKYLLLRRLSTPERSRFLWLTNSLSFILAIIATLLFPWR